MNKVSHWTEHVLLGLAMAIFVIACLAVPTDIVRGDEPIDTESLVKTCMGNSSCEIGIACLRYGMDNGICPNSATNYCDTKAAGCPDCSCAKSFGECKCIVP